MERIYVHDTKLIEGESNVSSLDNVKERNKTKKAFQFLSFFTGKKQNLDVLFEGVEEISNNKIFYIITNSNGNQEIIVHGIVKQYKIKDDKGNIVSVLENISDSNLRIEIQNILTKKHNLSKLSFWSDEKETVTDSECVRERSKLESEGWKWVMNLTEPTSEELQQVKIYEKNGYETYIGKPCSGNGEWIPSFEGSLYIRKKDNVINLK